MSTKKVFLILASVLLAGVNASWAASASSAKASVIPGINQSLTANVTPKKGPEEKLSGSAQLAYSGNTYAEGEYEAQRSLGVQGSLGYKLSEYLSVSSVLAVEKMMNGPGDTILANIPVKLSYNRFALFNTLNVTNRLTATLPTNETVRKDDRFRGAINVGSDFRYAVKSLPMNIVYGLGLTRNIHEFEGNFEGSPNIEYSLINALSVDAELFKNVGVGLSGIHRQSRTYQGFERSSFGVSAFVDFQMTKSLSAGIEHSNEGNALASNGRDSNIKLFNENTSVLSAGLKYLF